MTWYTAYRTRALPAYGRIPFTWLVGMQHFNTFRAQSRVVWSSIAAGGRHILNYAPGDYLGATLLDGDGSPSATGLTYQQVIRSVQPNEPVLCHVQNRISREVMCYDWYPGWGRRGDDTVLDTLFRLGIQPNEGRNGADYKIVFADHAAIQNEKAELPALRAAVQKGTVLVATPGGDERIARAFGVVIPDPKVRGEQERLDLSALKDVLPGADGLKVLAKRGPATGVEPESGLTDAGIAQFGAVGKGFFVYLNFETTYLGWHDSLPVDLAAWERLIGAVLRKAGVTVPHRVVDATGAMDGRFVAYTLDTQDGTQRYLLVQCNDVVAGSLSAWGIEERAKAAFARHEPDAPAVIEKPEDAVTIQWTQPQAAEALLWVKRKIEAESAGAGAALDVFLDGGEKPIGGVRAFRVPGRFVWEAGLVLDVPAGKHSLTLKGKGRRIEIERALLLPAQLTARVEVNDGTVRGCFDVGRRKKLPILDEGGARLVEVQLRPGEGTLISLVDEEADALQVRPLTRAPRAGMHWPVEVVCRDAGGKLARNAHTVCARVLREDGSAVPGLEAKALLRNGHAVLDLHVAVSDPPGRYALEVADLSTGATVRQPFDVVSEGGVETAWTLDGLPLLGGETQAKVVVTNQGKAPLAAADCAVKSGAPWVRAEEGKGKLALAQGQERTMAFALCLSPDAPPGRTILELAGVPGAGGFVLDVPPAFEFEVEPPCDMKVPDVVVFEFAGRVRNRTTEAAEVFLAPGLPEESFPGGKPSRRIEAPPGKWVTFHVLAVVTRQVARKVRARDLTMPVRLENAEGAAVAERRVRLLTNPWDTEPPRIGTLDGGTLSVSVLNATRNARRVKVSITPPAGLAAQKADVELRLKSLARIPARLPLNCDGALGEGVYGVPYEVQVDGQAGPKGVALVEVKTGSRWWVTSRSLVAGPDTEFAEEAADPWALPKGVFEAEAPPKNWKLNVLSACLPWQSVQPRPPVNSVAMAATRLRSPAARKVKVRTGWASQNGVWQDGKLISGDKNKATAGFVGKVWLNAELIFDNVPKKKTDEFSFVELKPHGLIRKGSNTLLVQVQIRTVARDKLRRDPELGTAFLRFVDVDTGKRITDMTFDISPPKPADQGKERAQ